MSAPDTRAQLREWERLGLIRSWLESGGHFVVSMDRGPSFRINSKRDLDMLAGTILRRAALR